MEEIVLKAKHRQVIGKQVRALRREGRLPAVLYGRSLKSPIPVTLDLHETSQIIPTVTSSHLVIVDVDGERHTALIKERQRQPVTGMLVHLDFQVVSMTEKLRAYVFLELTGESPAVRDLGGMLVQSLNRVEVESLPGDLPERIVVDLSDLRQIGDAVHIRDLGLSAAIEVLADPDEVIVVVMAPTVEEVAVAGLEGVPEPEVIERGKKEEDF